MPLEDFMMPGENVRYTSPKQVNFRGGSWDFYITDRRIMFHRRKGRLFKRDNISSENIPDLTSLDYVEKGLRKKGIIKIVTNRKKLEFSGSRETILPIYQELQTLFGEL